MTSKNILIAVLASCIVGCSGGASPFAFEDYFAALITAVLGLRNAGL